MGVVGCGAVAEQYHLPAIAACERAELVALVDRSPARLSVLAERYAPSVTAAEADDVVDLIDAAVVSVPNPFHAEVAIQLLRRGVHVLVEKPMALSTAECNEMIKAASASGVTLAVGLDYRFIGTSRAAKGLFDAGTVGDVQSFDMRIGVPSNWPFASTYVLSRGGAGGGVLVDYGVHVLDLLLWWLGSSEVLSYEDDAMGGVEGDALAQLRLANGATGTVEISRTRLLRNTLQVAGERGRVEVVLWDHEGTITLDMGHGAPPIVGAVPLEPSPFEGFIAVQHRQMENFVDAVLTGRPPLITGAEGRRSVEVIESCYAMRRPWRHPWDPAEPGPAGARRSAVA